MIVQDRVTREELKEYLDAQVVEILRHKWYLSENAGHDAGFDFAAFDWIKHYSASFRQWWWSARQERIAA